MHAMVGELVEDLRFSAKASRRLAGAGVLTMGWPTHS